MSYDSLFDAANELVGQIGGDYFDIWRPDYSVPDNAPSLVATSKKFRCDPTGLHMAEPRYNGVDYYDVFGPKSLILPGDVLTRSTADGMTPAVTISTYSPLKAVMGIRTSRRGKIIDSSDDANPVYDNIYFDFLGESFPGRALNRTIEDSLSIPNTKAVLFRRDNISRQRMHLVETDLNRIVTLPDGTTQQFQRKWLIDAIDYSGNVMILTIHGA